MGTPVGRGPPPALGKAPTREQEVHPRAQHPRGEGGGYGGEGAVLQLTIACSILLSMATTLAPEALEETGEAEGQHRTHPFHRGPCTTTPPPNQCIRASPSTRELMNSGTGPVCPSLPEQQCSPPPHQ